MNKIFWTGTGFGLAGVALLALFPSSPAGITSVILGACLWFAAGMAWLNKYTD